MRFAILDCYTDEPSGLGVPPFIGTYPRYFYGSIIKNKHEVFYLTIDDLRDYLHPKKEKEIEKEIITDIKRYNLTKNRSKIDKILSSIDFLIINSGVQTPGKYLSGYPGIVKEIISLLNELKENNSIDYSVRNSKFKTILAGPGAEIGEGLFGGKKSTSRKFDNEFDYVIKDLEYKFDSFFSEGTSNSLIKKLIEKNNSDNFADDFKENYYSKSYDSIKKSSILGAKIVQEINHIEDHIVELETMRGCRSKSQCSFCTEKLKSSESISRDVDDIILEVKALNSFGIKNFRLGKQTCLYSYGNSEKIRKLLSNVKKYSNVLHIDNVNPSFVTEDKTKIIVENTTSGNIAAFGVESFDENVIKKNYLNSNPEEIFSAIKIINKYGSSVGDNGMPKFLPGINILFGLNGESRETHSINMDWFNKIVDSNLLLRRINIREVVIFDGTPIAKECGIKYLRKNSKYYWKWRDEIRQKIDVPMLKKIVPKGTILKDLVTEIHDGNTTFARQIGTYPLAVGIQKRLPLHKRINISVKDYMKRSIVGEDI